MASDIRRKAPFGGRRLACNARLYRRKMFDRITDVSTVRACAARSGVPGAFIVSPDSPPFRRARQRPRSSSLLRRAGSGDSYHQAFGQSTAEQNAELECDQRHGSPKRVLYMNHSCETQYTSHIANPQNRPLVTQPLPGTQSRRR